MEKVLLEKRLFASQRREYVTSLHQSLQAGKKFSAGHLVNLALFSMCVCVGSGGRLCVCVKG